MKFVSKSSNLLIVLRAGLSAQPITGTPAKPTVSVRFKDGIAEVPDGELTDMMLAHAGFGGDFISAEIDPYAGTRKSVEPEHVLTELKYGTPIARTSTAGVKMSPEMQKIVASLASEMAKQMLPGMVEETLKSILSTHEGAKVAEKAPVVAKTGKKKGRPAKAKAQKVEEPTVEEINTVFPDPRTQESAA